VKFRRKGLKAPSRACPIIGLFGVLGRIITEEVEKGVMSFEKVDRILLVNISLKARCVTSVD
jgi:hypothetical protein